MRHGFELLIVSVTVGCAGGLEVFSEMGKVDSGEIDFDPGGSTDTGMTASGSGSGGSGSSGSGGSGSGSSGSGSSGSGSSGDGSAGSGSSGDDSTGGDSSSGSGSSGSGSSGSGSSGSGSTGGSSSSGGSTGGGGSTVTSARGQYILQQAAGEYYPGYYPCRYVWDAYLTTGGTYCPGCDFVLSGSFTLDIGSSARDASYCGSAGDFTATLAHDSDYFGSMPTALYYDPSYRGWYPMDYSATLSGSTWRWESGYKDYAYVFWYYAYYYTNYGVFSANVY